jgi:monoamine oxidase
LVLEARDRIGGRAYTLQSYDGAFPVELGAEFIHGSARATVDLMNAAGENSIDIWDEGFQLRDGRLTQGDDIWDAAERLLERVDLHGSDRSIEDFLQSLSYADATPEQIDGVRALVEGFDAAVTTDASIIGIAKEWRSGANNASARPVNGYAPIMQYLARIVSAQTFLRTRVDKIVWTHNSVQIHAMRSGEPLEIQARHAIVTLPIGVLRHDTVTFSPPLPREKQEAIGAIAMGPVIKVVLDFRSEFWGRGGFFQAPQCPFRTMWTRLPQRTPLLVAWAGGGAAERMIEKTYDPIDAALDSCQMLFPSVDVRAELRTAYYHDWQADPFACGAYSFLRVGGGNARDVLAAPIDNTLIFAGEATWSEDAGTVAGALESGYRAADEIYS